MGYLKFCGIAVKIPVWIPQVCGFVVRIPGGIPQVLWLRGQDWLGYLKFVASCSGSRLGYLKLCGFVPVGIPQDCGFAVKIPVGTPQVFVASWSRPVGIPRRRGQDPGSPVGAARVCGFAIKIPVWDTSSLVIRLGFRQGYLKFVA